MAEAVGVVAPNHASNASGSAAATSPAIDKEWREELTHRVRSYRARRARNGNGDPDSQSALPFDQESTDEFLDDPSESNIATGLDLPGLEDDQYEDPLQATLAAAAARISMEEASSEPGFPGISARREDVEHLVIDVSRPAEVEESPAVQRAPELTAPSEPQLLPVADIATRRHAGLVDAVCLAVAYAGILGLFAAFGGRLALSKLDAAVCGAIAALLYTQFFTLFTVMGGATPGMMLAGLRLVSFDGRAPKPMQLAWRSFGYLVSGGTAFMGFLAALWDEDHLSWHDRMSQTYITSAEAIFATEADATPHHAPPA
ncbi:MAG TPA: RDD family protein [Candidatus Acidoferrum sp.]|nr:RDD family protein [Candidatus Acidoferrum sp.]